MKLKLVFASLVISTLAYPAFAQTSPGTSPTAPGSPATPGATSSPMAPPSTTGSGSESAGSWYVLQDSSTKKCTVSNMRPTGSTAINVVGNSPYPTKAEAESGMGGLSDCSAQ